MKLLRFPSRRKQRGFILNPYQVFGPGFSPQPTFSNVSLLIHGDSRPFIDVSGNTFPVANYARQLVLTSGSIENSGSGSGSQALLVPANTKFVFGTGAWCIAAYAYSGTANGCRIFDTRTSSGGTTGVTLIVNATTMIPSVIVNNVNYGVGGGGLPAANLTVPQSARTHVACTYDGTTLRMFVGGSLSWSHTVSLNVTANNQVCIGNTNDLNSSFAGQRLDEVIVIKGEALYTSAFTPPTRYDDTGEVIANSPVNPVTFSNVKLLVHGSSLSNGSTSITDSSSGGKSITVQGNAQGDTSKFRIGTSSIKFDGTDDYLQIGSSTDWAFGTGDYCVELQRYSTTTGSIRTGPSTYNGGTDGWTYQENVSAAGDFAFNETGDGVDINSQSQAMFTVNTWAHAAIARWSGLLMAFIEGELMNFVADTQTVTNGIDLYIGRLTNVLTTRDWTGNMQEIRITKGESVYKRSFVVQTAAHPNS